MLHSMNIPLIDKSELNNFFSLSDGIEYLRIIRDPTPNQYMCLIKFKSQVQPPKIHFDHLSI